MSKRIKSQIRTIETRDEAEALVGEIAMLELNRERLVNTMETRIQCIREEYEGELAGLAEQLKEALPVIQRWADVNPEVFGKNKSLVMVHGTIGFRTGKHQCKVLPGWTWDRVRSHLLNKGLGYTDSKVTVDKDGLIADREKLGLTGLSERGVCVIQEESFFVEPKREIQQEVLSK